MHGGWVVDVDVDVVVVPTERILPPLLSDMIKAAREGTGEVTTDIIANTQPFNVYGIPAVTVPCGFSKSGLPMGLTFAGPHFSEGRILALARAFERATEWHKRRPAVSPTMPVPPVLEVQETRPPPQVPPEECVPPPV